MMVIMNEEKGELKQRVKVGDQAIPKHKSGATATTSKWYTKQVKVSRWYDKSRRDNFNGPT